MTGPQSYPRGDAMVIETGARCPANGRDRRSPPHVRAALMVTLAFILFTSPPVRSQTVDEMANPEEALRKCWADLKAMEDKRARYDALRCDEVHLNFHRYHDEWARKADETKPRVEQANALSRQWQERYDLLTPLFERADAECRSSSSFAAACQTRDQYKQQREEAAFSQRKAEEIGKRLSEEYRSYVENRDGWTRAYQKCEAIGEVYRWDHTGVNATREEQLRKCDTLEALVQQFPSGRTSGPTTPQPQTQKPSIKVSISGPTVAKVGETVTLVADPSGSEYRYDWDVDGQRSLSKTGNNTIRVPLANETPKDKAHVFTLKVTEVRTGRYLGQSTHRLRVDKAVPMNITLTLECPDSAIPGTAVTCRARVDEGTLSSLGNMQYGAWGYWWYVDQKAIQTTGDTMSFRLPEKGAEVLVKFVKATGTSGTAQELKWTTKAIRAMPTGRSYTGN